MLDNESPDRAPVRYYDNDAALSVPSKHRTIDTLDRDLFIDDQISGMGPGVNTDHVSVLRSINGLLDRMELIILPTDCECFTSR